MGGDAGGSFFLPQKECKEDIPGMMEKYSPEEEMHDADLRDKVTNEIRVLEGQW